MISYLKRQLELYRLNKKLEAYVKTLSPEKQRAANELRKKFKGASAQGSVSILMAEAAKIQEKQMRVVEKLERLA